MRCCFILYDVKEKFCPQCGAYWDCDCVFEEPPPVDWAPMPTEGGCDHDWVEVLGVELDDDLQSENAQVFVCRLCGLYAVENRV